LYSLRYGTVPVVRATGGLRDTVVDVAQDKRRANGFAFETYTAEDMLQAVSRAVTLYRDDPRAWRDIQQRGMEQDLSWEGSAKVYRGLYRKLGR
jgi:starch synthase